MMTLERLQYIKSDLKDAKEAGIIQYESVCGDYMPEIFMALEKLMEMASKPVVFHYPGSVPTSVSELKKAMNDSANRLLLPRSKGDIALADGSFMPCGRPGDVLKFDDKGKPMWGPPEPVKVRVTMHLNEFGNVSGTFNVRPQEILFRNVVVAIAEMCGGELSDVSMGMSYTTLRHFDAKEEVRYYLAYAGIMPTGNQTIFHGHKCDNDHSVADGLIVFRSKWWTHDVELTGMEEWLGMPKNPEVVRVPNGREWIHPDGPAIPKQKLTPQPPVEKLEFSLAPDGIRTVKFDSHKARVATLDQMAVAIGIQSEPQPQADAYEEPEDPQPQIVKAKEDA